MLLLLILLLDLPQRLLPAMPVLDFASVTVGMAEDMEGRPVELLVRLASAPAHSGPWIGYDCQGDGPHRTVYLRAEPEAETRPVLVKGRLRVIRHPGRTIDGQWFEGFTELRLMACGS